MERQNDLCLFIHDTKISNIDGRYYTNGNLGSQTWERYLKVFSKLWVIGSKNEEKIADYSKLTLVEHENVIIFPIPGINTPKRLIKNLQKALKTIKSLISQSNYLIIRLPSRFGIIGALIAKVIKKPVLIEMVGCPWDAYWNYGNMNGKILAPIMTLFTKIIVRNANYVIYVTKFYLQKRYPTRGFSIDCSNVNILEPSINILENRIRKIRTLNYQREIKIGMIGSLNIDYKGFETAIKAIWKLNGFEKLFHLYILGEGNPKKWQQMAKSLKIGNLITFCGTLPMGKPVQDWIDDIDIFIMPSITEGLPRSMIEAMSRGCPVIGTNVGGIPELTSIIINNPKDYLRLANIIKELVGKIDYMTQLARDNFFKSREYSSEIIDKRRTHFLVRFHQGC